MAYDWKKEQEEHDKLFNAAMDKSNALPKGLQVGKIFSIQVADGYAYYEITKVGIKTVSVKWRKELSVDEWQDSVLGHGGSFPRSSIERVVMFNEALRDIFK